MGEKKCMRPGPITSNGYLNFMRDYRKNHCGMTPQQSIRCGAKAWNALSCNAKKKYRLMGCGIKRKNKCKPKRKKRPSCKPKRKKRSCKPKRKKRSCKPKRKKRSCKPKRKKRSCKPKRRRPKTGCKRKKCTKPGPVTNNGYLNFIRFYRRKHCGLKPREIIRKAARAWCSLHPDKQDRFNRMACKVTTSKRRKATSLCRSARKAKKRC